MRQIICLTTWQMRKERKKEKFDPQGRIMQQDIRWKQRFANYEKALGQLDEALKVVNPTLLERAGIIQMFEFTSELAWNTLRDYLQNQGINDITGSRDATRKAFKHGIIEDGTNWMKMLESRNLTSHIYDETIAETILQDVKNIYHKLFKELQTILQTKQKDKD
jgi:nucleotidyltransferase substrate binding protein (TIGR01987 family)